jgi:cobalt-zinc-cadmium efflux system protein
VKGVHDLHVWSLTSGKASLTAHVVHLPGIDAQSLLEPLKNVLAERFSVFHTTLQMESTPCAHTADGCNYTGPARHAEHDHEHHHDHAH